MTQSIDTIGTVLCCLLAQGPSPQEIHYTSDSTDLSSQQLVCWCDWSDLNIYVSIYVDDNDKTIIIKILMKMMMMLMTISKPIIMSMIMMMGT